MLETIKNVLCNLVFGLACVIGAVCAMIMAIVAAAGPWIVVILLIKYLFF